MMCMIWLCFFKLIHDVNQNVRINVGARRNEELYQFRNGQERVERGIPKELRAIFTVFGTFALGG